MLFHIQDEILYWWTFPVLFIEWWIRNYICFFNDYLFDYYWIFACFQRFIGYWNSLRNLTVFILCVCVLNNLQKLFTLGSNFFSDRFLCIYTDLSDYYLCLCTCIINILSLICYFSLCIWYFGNIFHFLFSSELLSFSYCLGRWLLLQTLHIWRITCIFTIMKSLK